MSGSRWTGVKRKKSATVDTKIRMKEPLRARIERAAARRGVSMNTEMVLRLERAFETEDWVAHFQPEIYGRQLSAVLQALGRVMRDTGRQAGFMSSRSPEGADGWIDDPYAFDQAFRGAVALLEALRPAGDPKSGRSATTATTATDGAAIANAVAAALADPDSSATAELREVGPRTPCPPRVRRL